MSFMCSFLTFLFATLLVLPLVLSQGDESLLPALLEGFQVDSLTELITGTYEFEMFGRPHRLYICGGSEAYSLYWSITDTTVNEYTIAVGRQVYLPDLSGEEPKIVSRCDMYKFHGDTILTGYYEIALGLEDGGEGQPAIRYTLRESFPTEKAPGGPTDHAWNFWSNSDSSYNEYEMVRLSPAIVGNPDLEGYQCFDHHGHDIYEIYSQNQMHLWESEFKVNADGIRIKVVDPITMTSCWKLDNAFGNTMQAGYHYGYDFKWSGKLLLERFDSVNKNKGCAVGSSLMVQVEEDLAIYSYQCEDKVTGETMLLYLNEDLSEAANVTCPYEISERDEDLVSPYSQTTTSTPD